MKFSSSEILVLKIERVCEETVQNIVAANGYKLTIFHSFYFDNYN